MGVSVSRELEIKVLGQTESPNPKGSFYLAHNIFGLFFFFFLLNFVEIALC